MNALIIARRDLASYLQGFSAYIIMAALLIFNGLFFQVLAVAGAQYSSDVLRTCFELIWGFSVATAILLTMRSMADEYTLGTEVLLRTSVVRDLDIVVGKWLAAVAVVALYVSLTVHMPLLIFWHGKISVGQLLVGYLGVLMGGGVAAALGVFCSALFRNQLVAGLVGGLVAVYLSIAAWHMTDIVDPPFAEVLSYMAIFNQHTVPFLEGRLSLSSVVFHVTFGGLLLWLSTLILNGRRWE